jgi:hypothetical protein
MTCAKFLVKINIAGLSWNFIYVILINPLKNSGM